MSVPLKGPHPPLPRRESDHPEACQYCKGTGLVYIDDYYCAPCGECRGTGLEDWVDAIEEYDDPANRCPPRQ